MTKSILKMEAKLNSKIEKIIKDNEKEIVNKFVEDNGDKIIEKLDSNETFQNNVSIKEIFISYKGGNTTSIDSTIFKKKILITFSFTKNIILESFKNRLKSTIFEKKKRRQKEDVTELKINSKIEVKDNKIIEIKYPYNTGKVGDLLKSELMKKEL